MRGPIVLILLGTVLAACQTMVPAQPSASDPRSTRQRVADLANQSWNLSGPVKMPMKEASIMGPLTSRVFLGSEETFFCVGASMDSPGSSILPDKRVVKIKFRTLPSTGVQLLEVADTPKFSPSGCPGFDGIADPFPELLAARAQMRSGS